MTPVSPPRAQADNPITFAVSRDGEPVNMALGVADISDNTSPSTFTMLNKARGKIVVRDNFSEA